MDPQPASPAPAPEDAPDGASPDAPVAAPCDAPAAADADTRRRRRVGLAVAAGLVLFVFGLGAWLAHFSARRAAGDAAGDAAVSDGDVLLVRLAREGGVTHVRVGGADLGAAGEAETAKALAARGSYWSARCRAARVPPRCRIDASPDVPTPDVVAVAQALVAAGLPEVKFDGSGRR